MSLLLTIMMAITHAIISSAGTSLILGKTDLFTIGLAVLGSQLPDLDTSSSFIGQICFPLSRWLEENFPHRTITHSLLATTLLTAIALSLGFYQGDLWLYLAVPIAHLLACFSDCFTKQGVQLFYPMPVWAISVSNPNRRLRTGSTAEYYVLAIASLILFMNIKLIAGNGSLNNAISLKIGLRPEIIRVYNQSANTNMFTANIKGYYASDRLPLEEEFLIVNNEGNEFILSSGWGRDKAAQVFTNNSNQSLKSNNKNKSFTNNNQSLNQIESERIYKTGTNIIVEKLDLQKGKPIQTEVKSILFDDELVNNKLNVYNNNNDYVYLKGSLIIDYPEEIELQNLTNQYQYFTLSNNTVTLDHCPLSQAIALLKDQYGLGQVSLIIKKPL